MSVKMRDSGAFKTFNNGLKVRNLLKTPIYIFLDAHFLHLTLPALAEYSEDVG